MILIPLAMITIEILWQKFVQHNAPKPFIVSLSTNKEQTFSKTPVTEVTVVKNLGIKGDAHYGTTVQHLSRVKADPTQPNLRQIHLIPSELFDELKQQGFIINPGDLGENITTIGIDLRHLSVGTKLHLGKEVILELTGLRNPCHQIDKFKPGLMNALLEKNGIESETEEKKWERKAGVMAIVLEGGTLHVGDEILVTPPNGPFKALQRV